MKVSREELPSSSSPSNLRPLRQSVLTWRGHSYLLDGSKGNRGLMPNVSGEPSGCACDYCALQVRYAVALKELANLKREMAWIVPLVPREGLNFAARVQIGELEKRCADKR